MTTSLNGTTSSSSSSAGDLIKDSSDQTFRADVIEASGKQPILVDFWAPWCGPCRQLTPVIEKIVTEKAGAIKLIKINIDANPHIAGQLRIQSIPAVFAFADGRPIDGFMGARPEGEIRRFVEKVIAAAPVGVSTADSPEAQVSAALTLAEDALKIGDLGQAAQSFGTVLQHYPENTRALIGLARVYLAAGETSQARSTLDMVPEAERKSEAYTALFHSLRLLEEATSLDETAVLEAALEADPDDYQARFDLALALNAKGKYIEAAEALVDIFRRDRSWNDDAARKKLLEFFSAWGATAPATIKGRRLLSAALFS